MHGIPVDQRRAARAIAVLLVASAGCGSARRASEPRATPAAVPDCEAAGIDARGARQGTCVTGGVVRTVVDRGRPLALARDVELRLAGVTAGRNAVRVSLAVTNLSQRPFRWPSHPAQIALYFGDRLIPRSGGAGSVRLAPGRSGEVTARWRLRVPSPRALRRRGTAVVVVPPSEARQGARSVGEALRIGVLRLWQ